MNPMKRFLLFSLFVLAFSNAAAQDDDTSGWPVEQRCVGEPTAPPEGWTFEGAILMTGYAGIHAVQADWETPRVVSTVYARNPGVDGSAGLSPDRRWFAAVEGEFFYSDTLNHLYVIDEIVVYSTVHRNEVYRVPWRNPHLERWGAPQMYWLDNEHLIYEWSDTEFDHPGELRVINPFDGTSQSWTGKLNLADVGTYRNSIPMPSQQYPSPDFTLSLYEPEYNGPWGIYDVATGELLTPLSVSAYRFATWKPDSSQFITEVESEPNAEEAGTQLTLFDRNGTPLDTIFALNAPRQLNVDHADWSPNQDAFAYAVEAFSPVIQRTLRRLYIADMQNKTITDTCLNVGRGLAWSPDGTQLAFFQPGSEQTRVMVFDLETWSLHPVGVHLADWLDYVIGWRANDQVAGQE
jgi:hypothetical protein